MADTRWNEAEVKLKVRGMIRVLESLLAARPAPYRETALGGVLRCLEVENRADGFPTTSRSAAPTLLRPTNQPMLRSRPDDPLRRKREAGFAGSSVEDTVMGPMGEGDEIGGLLNDVCDNCGGTGNIPRQKTDDDGEVTTWVEACKRCDGAGKRFSDPIGERALDVMTRLWELLGHGAVIERSLPVILNAADNVQDDSIPYLCDGCHRPVYGGKSDPIRRGLCDACRQAYRKWRVDDEKTNDENLDRTRFCAQHKRHEGHHEASCGRCAETASRADDSWKAERGVGV